MSNTIFKVREILPLQTGQTERGVWQSQDIIVTAEQNVEYPDELLLHFRGEKTNIVKSLTVGDRIEVSYSSGVRSFQGKDGRTFYNQEHNCWGVRIIGNNENNTPL